MKTTFSYFPGMFENPEPVKLFLKNKIKSNQNQFRSQKWLQHPFFNCVAMNSKLPVLEMLNLFIFILLFSYQ